MENKFYKFLDIAFKVIVGGFFLYIMYYALTFLYEAAKIIFK
jgi:hypothetical protein